MRTRLHPIQRTRGLDVHVRPAIAPHLAGAALHDALVHGRVARQGGVRLQIHIDAPLDHRGAVAAHLPLATFDDVVPDSRPLDRGSGGRSPSRQHVVTSQTPTVIGDGRTAFQVRRRCGRDQGRGKQDRSNQPCHSSLTSVARRPRPRRRPLSNSGPPRIRTGARRGERRDGRRKRVRRLCGQFDPSPESPLSLGAGLGRTGLSVFVTEMVPGGPSPSSASRSWGAEG